MRSLLALCAIGLLSVGTSACGNAYKGAGSASRVSSTPKAPSASTQKETKADRDKDNDGSPDGDTNNSLLDFGHAANAADSRTITALIKRYYAIAAAEDGAKACSMIYSSFAKSVPEDYGTSPPGPPYARGTTCPAVLTRVFKHFHSRIMVKLSKLDVFRVGIKGRQGVAVLHFGAMPEREITVAREGHTWKLDALVDSEVP